MKFEKIEGVQHVILEEDDNICITVPDQSSKIQIKKIDEKLDISGNSSIVNSISGNGMLDKVYIPPVVSSKEIIDKCDKWLYMFKKVHDVFKKLVLSDEFRKQNVVMELSFKRYFSLCDSVKGRSIDLNLKQYGIVIKEGVTISIGEDNDDIYAYLMASVLDYYILKNLSDKDIDLMHFNNVLYSDDKVTQRSTVPILALLGSLTESQEYYQIVASIIGNHNIGESSEQLITNLKNRISSQQISNTIDSDISYSATQCEYILKKNKNN